MAKGKATSTANTSGTGAAAATKLVEALLSRVDAMQTDLKSVTDNLLKSAVAAQQTSQVGAIATKLDVGSDESQSAGIALDSGNKRSYDDTVHWQALRFADRDRTHFDNMQVLLGLAVSNSVFATSLCQNLATVDSHQQCGRNATSRAKA